MITSVKLLVLHVFHTNYAFASTSYFILGLYFFIILEELSQSNILISALQYTQRHQNSFIIRTLKTRNILFLKITTPQVDINSKFNTKKT